MRIIKLYCGVPESITAAFEALAERQKRLSARFFTASADEVRSELMKSPERLGVKPRSGLRKQLVCSPGSRCKTYGYASIVEMVSVVSSRTSSSTRTVSRDVNSVALFSVAASLILCPSDRALVAPTSLVFMM